jgi:hypothetical protein
MFRKGLIGLFFAGALAFSAVAADISIRIGPPRASRERRMSRPSPNHMWISGYQRWNGNAYAWSPGRWEQPPRRGARWQAHRWVHQKNGWVLVEGRWR